LLGDAVQQQRDAGSILNRDRMDHGFEDQPQRVHQDVPLAAIDLLAAVEAARICRQKSLRAESRVVDVEATDDCPNTLGRRPIMTSRTKLGDGGCRLLRRLSPPSPAVASFAGCAGIALALLVLGAIGRVPRALLGVTLLVSALLVLQALLLASSRDLGPLALSGCRPLNALAILGVAVALARRARRVAVADAAGDEREASGMANTRERSTLPRRRVLTLGLLGGADGRLPRRCHQRRRPGSG